MSNHLLGWLVLIPALMWTASCVHYISQIGKEREQIHATHAGWDVLFNGLAIAVVAVAALRLLGR